MTKILDWRRSDDPRDVVHLAVQALAEGHIVALPSSSSYLLVASGLRPQAVEQLRQVSKDRKNVGVSLMVRSADETLDYFPDVPPAARRLAKKAWPGPIMLSLKDSHQSSLLRCLDRSIGLAMHDGSDRIRVWQPRHEVLDPICKLSSGPLICVLATPVRGTIADCIQNVKINQSVLAVDAGAVDTPGEPTVVEIDGNVGRIVHHGIVNADELRAISQWTVLFVCTGNTCRSPMAQAMMQRKITERFPDTLTSGSASVIALSAGVSAFGGDPASHGASAAIKNYGASLDQHQSTQLNSELVDRADLILAMGSRHRQVIVSQWPSVSHKVHLISPDGGEISDPFGGPLEVYLKCAQQLDQHTSYWIDRLDLGSLIQWQSSN
jgi:protein-tyrosine-phosphatase/tRNA A37 threonylcarbamoyladenosine synthetase subunit TsaC/SUA5/YrdC